MAITIEQLKSMPNNYKTGGFLMAIKTAKKMWQVKDIWYQQILLMDETGEILADVKLGKGYTPLSGYKQIKIIVCIIQESFPDGKKKKSEKKLLIDQFDLPTQIGEPETAINFVNGEPEKVVRGKIKCWLAASMLQSRSVEAALQEIQKPEMKEIIDSIIEG